MKHPEHTYSTYQGILLTFKRTKKNLDRKFNSSLPSIWDNKRKEGIKFESANKEYQQSDTKEWYKLKTEVVPGEETVKLIMEIIPRKE